MATTREKQSTTVVSIFSSAGIAVGLIGAVFALIRPR
jgi:hypothetical protein